MSYLAGLVAEDIVARDYERRGHPLAARRWRGSIGEIDLIAENGAGLIFIEVKKSKSFDGAAQSLSNAQMHRICATASEYLGNMPNGQLTEMRIDVALVNGTGELHVIENAFGA